MRLDPLAAVPWPVFNGAIEPACAAPGGLAPTDGKSEGAGLRPGTNGLGTISPSGCSRICLPHNVIVLRIVPLPSDIVGISFHVIALLVTDLSGVVGASASVVGSVDPCVVVTPSSLGGVGWLAAVGWWRGLPNTRGGY